LLEHDTAGDPITGIRWTHKTPAGIAELLRQLDIEVSANTVARLLRDMDFSSALKRKAIATDSSPDRDQQFRLHLVIADPLCASGISHHQCRYQKRELVGNFKNHGVKWDRTPVRVNDHDFRSDAIAVAIPYGIYDLLATAARSSSASRMTPPPLPPLYRRWWKHDGADRYFRGRQLLILADTGGK